MRMYFWVVVVVCVLGFSDLAHSGAAVAMRNKPKGGVNKGQVPQLPPGYVMGPGGIQKIPQDSENENASPDVSVNKNEEAVEVQDEVGLDEIFNALQESGKPWELIIDRQDKEVVVQEFIKEYLSQGVRIQKPAGYYADFIDEMCKNSPEMLQMPFARILQVVAVMEYDFDNGQNKDLMAQKILGPQVYEENKQRLMKVASQ